MPPAKSAPRRRLRKDRRTKDATVSATRTSRKTSSTVEAYPVTHLPERSKPCVLPTRVDKSDILSLSKTSVEISGVFESALFPCNVFAIEPSAMVDILDGIAYSLSKNRWMLGYPALNLAPSRRARSMATFLNHLTRHCWLAHAHRRKPTPNTPRQWVATKSSRLVSDGVVAEVPGLALVEAGAEASWGDVLCDVQMVPTADRMAEAIDRLATGATHVFDEQQDRLHHVGLAIAGDAFQVAYYDRAGCVLSGVHGIHENPDLFIRVIMGLTLVGKPYDGKDTSIVTRDGRRFVTIGGFDYEILETLSSSHGVCGSGTICWRCRRSGSDEDFFVKNTWAEKTLDHTEGDLLTRAMGVANIPKLVCEERVLRPDGQAWTTTSVRSLAAGPERWSIVSNLPQLELRRLVMRPCAVPLSYFSSKVELVSSLRDAVVAHEALYPKYGILHCDIKEDNIMLHGSLPRRRGLLVNFDRADCASESHPVVLERPKSSIPFTACDMLQVPRFEAHGVRHDLESFLYVIMFICTKYSGPSHSPRKEFDIRSSPLGPWFDGDVAHKEKVMFRYEDDEFRAFLDSIFDPYFDDLKDMVCKVRNAVLRPQGWEPSHSCFTVYLDEYLENHEDEREEAVANCATRPVSAKPPSTRGTKRQRSSPSSETTSDSYVPASPKTPTVSPRSSETSGSDGAATTTARGRRDRGVAGGKDADADAEKVETQPLRRSKRRKVA
ncbi:uncharacterized protein SCHCODRAFT_02746174 [Schizophyllum commune H4-8]|uniref:uncharacterized protein n=1 Tax=Schizophyllum commune (strain H4-8 / FGSC 9210) TaxID=578458 RepID=UPI00215E37F7|nr:uncharacterized protein SCHCODRAFT_02746174 [Schizophyllum commune H4-8]KAI5894629.1 hypothetical protein SCHCODRAFT_02746174 [Schizophyllum commune H4-8]